MKKNTFNILKVLISLGLILFILIKIDLTQFIKDILTIKFFLILVILLGVNIFNVFLSSFKLKVILQNLQGIDNLPLKKIFKYYFHSIFFGILLPTNFGSDGPKYYFIKNKFKNLEKTKIIASIFVERFTGLLSLGVLVLFSLFIPKIREYYLKIYFSIGNIFVLNDKSLFLIIISILLFLMIIFYFLIKNKRRSKNILKNFEKLDYKKVLLLSVGFQIIMILNNMLAFYLITGYFDIFLFIILVPITIFSMMLPISIQGIGLRDGLALLIIPIFILAIKPEEILLYTITMNLLVIITVVIGGLLYLKDKMIKND